MRHVFIAFYIKRTEQLTLDTIITLTADIIRAQLNLDDPADHVKCYEILAVTHTPHTPAWL